MGSQLNSDLVGSIEVREGGKVGVSVCSLRMLLDCRRTLPPFHSLSAPTQEHTLDLQELLIRVCVSIVWS